MTTAKITLTLEKEIIERTHKQSKIEARSKSSIINRVLTDYFKFLDDKIDGSE